MMTLLCFFKLGWNAEQNNKWYKSIFKLYGNCRIIYTCKVHNQIIHMKTQNKCMNRTNARQMCLLKIIEYMRLNEAYAIILYNQIKPISLIDKILFCPALLCFVGFVSDHELFNMSPWYHSNSHSLFYVQLAKQHDMFILNNSSL